MRWWFNVGLVFLILFSSFIQPSYGITSTTIQIEVNGTNNLPVKEATIEVLFFNASNASSSYFYTNENGTATFQGEQNQTYTFKITAENYEPLSKNITISPDILDYKLKFTLNPLKNQKDTGFLPILIPGVIGFLIFINWSIRFYNNRFSSNRSEKEEKYFLILILVSALIFYLLGLFWLIIIALIVYLALVIINPPSLEKNARDSLIVLSLLAWPTVLYYLLYNGKEFILFSDSLRFSVYIPIAALIGILSYLLLSIEEIFSQALPKHLKKKIIWGYIRRITIAPYIAILGTYVLLDAAQIKNQWFVLLFSFFTGMFTKTIEERLYKSVQGLLPDDLVKEFKEREKYKIEKLELVSRLDVEEDSAFELYIKNIKSVEQLKVADFELLKNPDWITKEYFCYIVEKAKEQHDEINRLKEILSLTPSELKLLVDKAKVYSIKDFANVDIDSIDWKMEVSTENTKISNIFKQKQIKAKELAKSEDFKLLSLEDLKKLNEICKTEDEFQVILSLHIDLKKLMIPGWRVEDTNKIRDIPINDLSQLKEQCSNEGNMKILQDKMKGSQRILELLEKINK